MSLLRPTALAAVLLALVLAFVLRQLDDASDLDVLVVFSPGAHDAPRGELAASLVPWSPSAAASASASAASHVRLRREARGGSVMHVTADDSASAYRGLGYAHAMDRAVQMFLVKLIAAGRLSECLVSSDKTNRVDAVLRALAIPRRAREAVRALDEETHAVLVAYSEGINAYMRAHVAPLEFLLVGYDAVADPWTPEDTMATLNIMGIADLADEQLTYELWILQALQNGADVKLLQHLHEGLLDELNDELVALIKRARLDAPVIPLDLPYLTAAPLRGLGSNNWAVAGSRTKSGGAMQAADPHLQTSRLPAVWYEYVLEIRSRESNVVTHSETGMGLPGVPCMAMGRTRHLSYSFTYGFGDQYSMFLEEVSAGRYRIAAGTSDDPHAWAPLEYVQETILRKGTTPLVVQFAYTRNGLVRASETDGKLADGIRLAGSFSMTAGGLARSLRAMLRLPHAATVQQASELQRDISLSLNFVTADDSGSIAYQQSGEFYVRGDGKHYDVVPHRGWVESERNKPDAFVAPAELVSVVNPPSGVIASANNNVCLYSAGHHGANASRCTISLHMGSTRVDRIVSRLTSSKEPLTREHMHALQQDTFSTPAYRLLSNACLRGELEALLTEQPEHAAVRELLAWNFTTGSASRAASLYDGLYKALLNELFGKRVFGENVWQFTVDDTPVLAVFSHLFDRVLESRADVLGLFKGDAASLRATLVRAMRAYLADYARPEALAELATWGKLKAYRMRNVFFDGDLPDFLGFDGGPILMSGSRSVVQQGGLFRSGGRSLNWGQSWTYVADLSEAYIETTLPGGPSGRRLSSLYTSELPYWIAHIAKRIDMPL